MNKGLLLAIFAACAARLCLATPASILSVTATNAPSTWEGVFRIRDIHPVALESNETAYLAIYTNSAIKDKGFMAALHGVVIDLLEERDGEAVRLLSAGTNDWGTAPHILAFGDILPATNEYWSIWRYPGNGGVLGYEHYNYTNGIMVQIDQCIYDRKPDFKWYRKNGIGIPSSEISPIDFSDHNIIWLNTNTVYKLAAYDFNFHGNPFSPVPEPR